MVTVSRLVLVGALVVATGCKGGEGAGGPPPTCDAVADRIAAITTLAPDVEARRPGVRAAMLQSCTGRWPAEGFPCYLAATDWVGIEACAAKRMPPATRAALVAAYEQARAGTAPAVGPAEDPTVTTCDDVAAKLTVGLAGALHKSTPNGLSLATVEEVMLENVRTRCKADAWPEAMLVCSRSADLGDDLQKCLDLLGTERQREFGKALAAALAARAGAPALGSTSR